MNHLPGRGRTRPGPRWRRNGLLAAVAGGGLFVNGCLATLQQNLDLILSPGAVQNALVAPYSDVLGLVELYARLFRN